MVDILKLLQEICPGWEKEYKFDGRRRFRFDFGNHLYNIAVEMEGGIYTGTGHAKTGRYLKDMEKYNIGQLKGWIILRYAYGQEDKISDDIKMALERRKKEGLSIHK